MSRSRYGPAAGASGGRAPLLATVRAPRFIRFDQAELTLLFNVMRDPLVSHVYALLCVHSIFTTGEFLGGYARLKELCTPPQPERGPRRAGPSMWQLRRAVDDLEGIGMAVRADTNEAQGQLRIFIQPRDSKASPDALARRKPRRVP